MPASGSNPAGPGGQSVAIAKRCARIASVLGFAVINAPRSVSYFTFGRQKICKPYLAKMGDENASHRSHRMDRRRRPGRAWPALVGCHDVQIGPPAQRGNQLARDAVRQSGSANMNAPADPAFMPPQCWLSRPGTAPRLGFLCRPSALVGQDGLIA